ncbi:hypothetical protein HaLaN_31363 [Haematococcus lacustris]|uniref:Uncharacterized protein n=1 Tax=Haematococcus lacustris TaxID=44745 RepID=A0A6A0AJF4_HAELA|nr:hypothetical protein HaLaN_31363 [Haematococcus lacustris]
MESPAAGPRHAQLQQPQRKFCGPVEPVEAPGCCRP